METHKPRPTAYHRALLDYLQTDEAELWHWFTSNKVRSEAAETVRLDLLKTAYRIDRNSAAELYRTADDVAQKMGLDAPVTLYQAQQAVGLNASLAWLPDEMHVVLHGAVQETLTPDEQTALLAHEFAHHELYSLEDGACLIAEQILGAMVSDPSAAPPHERTWRSFRLYTELFCDRRAAQVTDDIDACVRTLVKMETGLKEVSAAAYLTQAEEVLSKVATGSEGMTHPEMYIRAKALQLWRDSPDDPDEGLEKLVEGPLALQDMDLLRQRKVTELTRHFLQAFLQPALLRTDLTKGHARRFFDDFEFTDAPTVTAGELQTALENCDDRLRNYFCCVLLDFVTCDADLEEIPLAAAFLFATEVGLAEEFRDLAANELKLSKRALQKVELDAAKTMTTATAEPSLSSPPGG